MMLISLRSWKKRMGLLGAAVLTAILIFCAHTPGIPGGSNEERRRFLEKYGWETGESCRADRVRIPAVFDEIYLNYNQIQLNQGFDLQKYAGKVADRFQYVVTNYPNNLDGIRANLLVFEEKIIGGDICSVQLDGFMHEIARKQK